MTEAASTTERTGGPGAPPDLRPAAEAMGRLVAGVRDEQLGSPTPCPDYTLGDLVEHVGGLALAFAWAARKSWPDGAAGQSPSGDAARLPSDWRDRISADLRALAAAWQDPDAWQGMTAAGGIDLPGEVAGIVALDELVVHGWDVARSSGQPYVVADEHLGVVHGFVAQAQEQASGGGPGIFGPPVAVADDAPLLDRVIGLAGRDPGWGA